MFGTSEGYDATTQSRLSLRLSLNTNSSLSEHLIQVSKYNCLQYFQGRIKDIVWVVQMS